MDLCVKKKAITCETLSTYIEQKARHISRMRTIRNRSFKKIKTLNDVLNVQY